MGSGKKQWADEVSATLKGDLLNTAYYCLETGTSIMDDARLLAEYHRWHRACALCILSEEELAKSFILASGASQGRWDSELLKALTDHSQKQTLAEALRIYADRAFRFTRSAQDQLIPPTLPRPEQTDHLALEQAIREAHETRKENRTRDKQKMRFLYVNIARSGQSTSIPDATESDWEALREEHERFQRLAEALIQAADPSRYSEHFI